MIYKNKYILLRYDMYLKRLIDLDSYIKRYILFYIFFIYIYFFQYHYYNYMGKSQLLTIVCNQLVIVVCNFKLCLRLCTRVLILSCTTPGGRTTLKHD